MPIRKKNRLCTTFVHTKEEKRMITVSKELEDTKNELKALRETVEELQRVAGVGKKSKKSSEIVE